MTNLPNFCPPKFLDIYSIFNGVIIATVQLQEAMGVTCISPVLRKYPISEDVNVRVTDSLDLVQAGREFVVGKEGRIRTLQ